MNYTCQLIDDFGKAQISIRKLVLNLVTWLILIPFLVYLLDILYVTSAENICPAGDKRCHDIPADGYRNIQPIAVDENIAKRCNSDTVDSDTCSRSILPSNLAITNTCHLQTILEHFL